MTNGIGVNVEHEDDITGVRTRERKAFYIMGYYYITVQGLNSAIL